MLGGKRHTFANSDPISLFEIMGSPSEHYVNSVALQTPAANNNTVFFGSAASAIIGQLIADRSTLIPVKDMKSVHVIGTVGDVAIFIFY